ncbi:MAG: signal peptidase I [Pirellulales bacterium]|nr:signal peptidase I [Pirellulales bacterium]
MSTTLIFAALFLGLLVVSIALWVVFLRLGLRWAKAEGITGRRLAWATILVSILQPIVYIPCRFASLASEAQETALWGIGVVLMVSITCVVIMRVFKVRFLRSLQAWSVTLIPSIGMNLFLFLVLIPFVCEAYTPGANSMAPTLLGAHWEGVCPVCGAPNYGSPVEDDFGYHDDPTMICEQFHTCQTPVADKTILPSDRFLVAKFLTPRRWDLVTFRPPHNPSTPYVKRVIGLPGETVYIDDGAIWVNGEKLTPPDSLCGLKYVPGDSIMPWLPGDPTAKPWGTKDRPATLGEDEYFMLGDFSECSNDSRFWKQGAVPASHLQGVVTHIYWPPKRWKIIR